MLPGKGKGNILRKSYNSFQPNPCQMKFCKHPIINFKTIAVKVSYNDYKIDGILHKWINIYITYLNSNKFTTTFNHSQISKISKLSNIKRSNM